MQRSLHLALAFWLSSLVAPSPASAQSARELFLEGQNAYELGRYEDAVEAWEAAYAAEARPALKWNLAQAYERLGRIDDAIASLEVYLADAGDDAALAERAQHRLEALQSRRDRTRLTIVGGPAGGEVRVDGVSVGTLPIPEPVRVEPGDHAVEVIAEGFDPFRSNVSVTAGATVTIEVEMGPGAVPGETEGAAPRRFGASPVGWAVGGAGAAMLIAGGVTGILAMRAESDLLDRCPDRRCPGDQDLNDVRADADRGRALALSTDILLGAGVATLATGVVLLFVLPRDERRANEAGVTPVVGCDGAGCVAGAIGRF